MSLGTMVTIVERAHRDELIMAYIFGLEMLHHKKGGRPFTHHELDDVEAWYLLNAYANVVFGINPQFLEPVENDMPMDPEDTWDALDIDEDKIEIDKPPVNVEGEPLLPTTTEDN